MGNVYVLLCSHGEVHDADTEISVYSSYDKAKAAFDKRKDEWTKKMTEENEEYFACFENEADTPTHFRMHEGEVEDEIFDISIAEAEIDS